jgi:hypothetical protein
MTRTATVLVALITLVCALTLATVTAASANSRQPGQAAHRSDRIAAELRRRAGPGPGMSWSEATPVAKQCRPKATTRT